MSKTWKNWSELVRCQPQQFLQPTSIEELAEIVHSHVASGRSLRVVGSGHSFTPVAATNSTMISLEQLQGVELVEGETASVLAATKIYTLGKLLADYGLGLENQGDIDSQSLAGAIATGTHGTGTNLGIMSTQAVGFTLVTADGNILECSANHNPEIFKAAQVSLGSLGILAKIRMKLKPTYRLREVRRGTNLTTCLNELESNADQHRHYEFWWFPHTEQVLIKTQDLTDAAIKSSRIEHILNDVILENGVFWVLCELCRFLPSMCKSVSKLSAELVSQGETTNYSYQIFPTPRLVRFYEMEYAVPKEQGPDCLREIKEFVTRKNIAVHFPVEYRCVKGDDIYLSPAYGRDSAFIAVHMYKGMPYKTYFEGVEAIFRNHQGRPHWGKLHTRTAKELRQLYPMWDEFHSIRRKLDPTGVFMNDYLKQIFED
ncbi:FAD linked oxidase domain-containing protein [Nostoc sp. NIES-4103]|nr:FAD linked oxidase domain-containing protein [Nostoc sp. NIES-4103]